MHSSEIRGLRFDKMIQNMPYFQNMKTHSFFIMYYVPYFYPNECMNAWSMSTQNRSFYHAQPFYFLRVSSSIQKWPNTMGLGHIDIFHRPSPGPFRNEFCNQLDCIERHIIHVRQACLKPFDLMRREILLGIYYPQLSLIIKIVLYNEE